MLLAYQMLRSLCSPEKPVKPAGTRGLKIPALSLTLRALAPSHWAMPMGYASSVPAHCPKTHTTLQIEMPACVDASSNRLGAPRVVRSAVRALVPKYMEVN